MGHITWWYTVVDVGHSMGGVFDGRASWHGALGLTSSRTELRPSKTSLTAVTVTSPEVWDGQEPFRHIVWLPKSSRCGKDATASMSAQLQQVGARR